MPVCSRMPDINRPLDVIIMAYKMEGDGRCAGYMMCTSSVPDLLYSEPDS